VMRVGSRWTYIWSSIRRSARGHGDKNFGQEKSRIGMLEVLFKKETYGEMKRRAEDRSGWKSGTQRTCSRPAAE